MVALLTMPFLERVYYMNIMEKIKIRLNSKFTNENDKVVVKNIVAAFMVKGSSLILSIFTLPAYLRYFDNQVVLGLWFTILSVMSWIFSFDLGIGNGLRNKLVEAIVNNDKNGIKRYISSAYIIIAVMTLAMITVGLYIISLLNWNSIFNVNPSLISKEALLFALRCVFIGMMFQFSLNLISSVLYALQKSAINNFILLITQLSQHNSPNKAFIKEAWQSIHCWS